MILRYCKNRRSIQSDDLKTFYVLSFATGEDGVLYPKVVEDKSDTSIYGSFSDWSLSSMIASGINPESFSSPSTSINRLEASQKLASIDLSSLDSNSNPTE